MCQSVGSQKVVSQKAVSKNCSRYIYKSFAESEMQSVDINLSVAE